MAKDWPRTLDEEVQNVLSLLSEEGIQELLAHPDALHLSLGTDIRNRFGLWHGNEDLLKDCGTPDADRASAVILEAARQQLAERP